jgi:hypothetical protein
MLQTRAIEPGTLELLKQLMSLPTIEPFYLVGGTALALQLGHRLSVDLDLFTPHNFAAQELVESLGGKFDLSVETESPGMIVTFINEVKVDFVKMSYPILFPPLNSGGIRMLDIRDIAPMKLKAITQRGSKKDFFDIFFLLEKMSLEGMLQLFQEKFKMYETFHVVKSLTYFEDAEQYADPIVFDPTVSWTQVKSSVKKAVSKLIGL